uniref:Derlin n=1 Tax=Craspedostauros australis TaxID=1486917 RepID=A0A7R9ZS60_9STRA
MRHLLSSLDFLQKMQPITKGYVIMVGIVTVVGIALGEEMAQSVMALDPMRIIYGMEVWRIVTAASFLGKPSISWLLSGYYLYEHGSNLERLYGPAQFLVFLLTQVSLLTVLSMMFGMPFFASSMVTSMLHVLSRITPKMEVNWLIFKIHYYLLPLALMATDVLQAGNLSAGLPHVLGMLSGHFYFFHKTIWPKTGGEDWLNAPDFMVQRLDPDASKKAGKESVNKALKSRQKRKGKALGK